MDRREFLKLGGAAAGALVAGAGLAADPAGYAPEREYRACVIGDTRRGGYGHGLDVAFQKIPRIAVVGLADPDEKGRGEAVRRSGAARAYADWREMLEKERPNLLAIGPRWVERRLEMVSAAASLGAHVYMEKPIAASLEEADAIIAAAEKAGISIAVAHQARLAPTLLHLKKLVDEGLLGEVMEIRTRGKEDHRSGGEDLMVLGTHCMYLLRLFGGDPLWCAARVTTDGRDITVADGREATEPLGLVAGDTIHAAFAFAGGVQGHFASQKCSAGRGARFQMTVHGSKGVALVRIDPDPQVYHLPDPSWSDAWSGKGWQKLPGSPPNAYSGLTGAEASNKRIVEDLLRCAEKGGRPACGIHEARAALEMIHAVYHAHLDGRRVPFPLEERKHPLAR